MVPSSERARGEPPPLFFVSSPPAAHTYKKTHSKTLNTHNNNEQKQNTQKNSRRQQQQEVRHPRLHQVHADGGQQEGQDGRLHGVRQGLRPEQRRLQ